MEDKLRLKIISYTPFDDLGIPLGEMVSVLNTPLVFTKKRKIKSSPSSEMDFDHNSVLNKATEEAAAVLSVEESFGRRVSVFTSKPGLKFYTRSGFHQTP